MKYLSYFLIPLFTLAVSVGSVSAAPFNASGNPNIVANYPTGPHGIPGEAEFHEGADVVMRAGQSGNFQQWFYGTSASENLHGEHSNWKNVGSATTCPNGWILFVDPYPEWGDYLEPGANYCIHTNNFHPSH